MIMAPIRAVVVVAILRLDASAFTVGLPIDYADNLTL